MVPFSFFNQASKNDGQPRSQFCALNKTIMTDGCKSSFQRLFFPAFIMKYIKFVTILISSATEPPPKMQFCVPSTLVSQTLRHWRFEIEKGFNLAKDRGQESKISQICLPHKAKVGSFYVAREVGGNGGDGGQGKGRTKGKDSFFNNNILCNQTSGHPQLVASFIPSVKQTHKFSS